MSTLSKPITPADTRPAARVAFGDRLLLAGGVAALLLITAVPYLYAAWSAPPGRAFQGILFDVPDVAQYWSWMRDHQHSLLVPNRMTAEPNEPALFNLLWLILGQMQRLTGWSEAAMYQVLRLTGGAAFLVVLWWFLGLAAGGRGERWTAWLIAALGGGLGWIWVVEKYARGLSDVRFPLDVYVAEPNAFFSLLGLPHFLAAAALLLGTFGCFLQAERHGDDWRRYGLATLWALLLGLSHAYDLIMVYAILGTWVLVQFAAARRILWGRFWGLAAVGLISFPPAGYFTYLTTQNPLWREVLAQFDNAGVFTPNLAHIWILLGVPFLITLGYGAWLLWRRAAGRQRGGAPRRGAGEVGSGGDTMFHPPSSALHPESFVWVWAVVGFALLYIPTDFQIHMLNPYQVPLALLTARAVWRPGLAPGARRWLLAALVVLATLPTNAYLWSWRMLDMRRAEAPFFLSDAQVAALRWLDARSEERAVVLSGLEVGQYVPALTGQRALLAHWAQTAHFYDRRDDVARFFAADTPAAERRALLARFDVRYVVRGPEERALGGYDPAVDGLLRPVFSQGDVTIYQR